MNTRRPSFEKKELALSGSPYFYLPVKLPVYTVEVSHREAIDGALLQRALDRTVRRMPYLSDTLVVDHGAVYYAKNPLPMEAARFAGPRALGGGDTNYHMLDLTWDGNKTWFSMFHGFCDGQGVKTFLESVLYHYYCMKDGVEYDPSGIRADSTSETAAETVEPFALSYEVSGDFTMPAAAEQPQPYHLPEIGGSVSDDVLEYGFSLPSEAFMRFVKDNGASPAVMLSMLVGDAIRLAHPDADAPIQAIIPISIRRMLGCEETFKNCSSRTMLLMTGTPGDALPFAERAAALRGELKRRMNADLYRAITNRVGLAYRKRMEEAVDYREELTKPSGFMTINHDTFYVDYIGSLYKTGYSDRITDVRFLCPPPAKRSLHINIIEHDGRFRIACLACCDISPVIDALERVIKGHGLAVERMPLRRFTLPECAWQEGIL